jgi:aminoglycoside phosphotransferase (APT) family kinase protein
MVDEFHAKLHAALADVLGESVVVSRSERIPGGYSRVMRRVVVEVDGQERQLVWRGDPPADQEIVKTDRAREFAILSSLRPETGAPRAFFFDHDGSRFGTVSLIAEFIEGEPLISALRRTPQDEWPALVAGTTELAARIHATDLDSLPSEVDRPTDWEAHLDACVRAWRELEREQIEPAPLMRYVVEWLDRNRPPEVPLCLLHGDLQSPNIIIGDGAARAIDWEFCRIGDPREDLGYFAAMAAISPPDPIAGDLSTLCETYRRYSGLSEAQINPATVAYFSILPFGPMVRQFVTQVTALAEGRNRSLKTANLAFVLTAMVQGWIGLIRLLDGVSAPKETIAR